MGLDESVADGVGCANSEEYIRLCRQIHSIATIATQTKVFISGTKLASV
jgi:hypothetical protein